MNRELESRKKRKRIKLFAISAIIISIFIGVYSALIINKGSHKTPVTAETSIEIDNIKIETEELIEETIAETKEPYVSPVDFASLKEKNPDIIAWIKIPGTNIDYPILWSGDNDFYLHHDVDKNESKAGAIFLDGDDKPDFSEKHNILYGHNMKNKSMFQNIINFKNKDFFDENRDIYIYTEEKEYHLRTITALYTDASGEKRQTQFQDNEEFNKYVDKMTGIGKFRELPEEDIERLWSFITCSYEFDDARTILYAYEPDSKADIKMEETKSE